MTREEAESKGPVARQAEDCIVRCPHNSAGLVDELEVEVGFDRKVIHQALEVEEDSYRSFAGVDCTTTEKGEVGEVDIVRTVDSIGSSNDLEHLAEDDRSDMADQLAVVVVDIEIAAGQGL